MDVRRHDAAASSSVYTPRELLRLESDACSFYCERELARISATQAYIGGINSAVSGHYP